MTFARIGLAAVLAASMAGALPAIAQTQPRAGFLSTESSPGRDRGVMQGRITSIDFGRGQLTLDAGGHRVGLTVLPSTAIFRGRRELGISDLSAGMRVDVSVSEVGGRLVAQIIRVR